MNIEDIRIQQHFVLNPTTKWVAIQDPRPSFRKAFGTARFGKLERNGLYVTLGPVKERCERLIVASGLTLRHIRSTKGNGNLYPGFEVLGVPEATLAQLVAALHATVDHGLETLG
jgi:hypothetical protein